MKRSESRESAFKYIFERVLLKEENPFSSEKLATDEYDEFALRLYSGVLEHFSSLEEEITQLSRGFKRDRIYKVDMALLLLGAFEIKYLKDTDAPVVVSEILKLSKKYSSEKSGKFIHGILSKIIKNK